MDEDDRKDDNQASTSKKDTKTKGTDNDHRSFTESSFASRAPSSTSSDDAPKASVRKNCKQPIRKKRVQDSAKNGRVTKRRRPMRRHPVRRAAIRNRAINIRKRQRESVSTIFSRLTSRGGSRTPSCTYCGHRCCGRRYNERKQWRKLAIRAITKQLRKERKQNEKKKRRDEITNRKGRLKRKIYKKNNIQKKKQHFKHALKRTVISEAIQTGSVSKLLSKLIIKSNITPLGVEPPVDYQEKNYLKITPDMIYETLRRLATWRCFVPQEKILNYMKLNYPVNTNSEELNYELSKKLHIASVVGIVTAVVKGGQQHWCLTTALQDRGLTKTHVTLFWQLYGDTMAPVTKKTEEQLTDNAEEETNTAKKPVIKEEPMESRFDSKGNLIKDQTGIAASVEDTYT